MAIYKVDFDYNRWVYAEYVYVEESDVQKVIIKLLNYFKEVGVSFDIKNIKTISLITKDLI